MLFVPLRACVTLMPRSVDFVYIDARHDYKGAMEDIKAWWPKLKKGGLLSGHDFLGEQVE